MFIYFLDLYKNRFNLFVTLFYDRCHKIAFRLLFFKIWITKKWLTKNNLNNQENNLNTSVKMMTLLYLVNKSLKKRWSGRIDQIAAVLDKYKLTSIIVAISLIHILHMAHYILHTFTNNASLSSSRSFSPTNPLY